MNQQQRQQQLQNEFNKAGLNRHIQRLRSDEHRRLARTRSTVVITPQISRSSSRDYLLKPIKGSVVLFWARQGSPLIPALEKAYATGDEKSLKQMSGEFEQQLKGRKILTLDAAFDKLLASHMYFDLLYGNKTLISNLALVEGIEYGAVGFAYNGGYLRDADFKIVEHHRAFERVRYDTLIVKTPPDLSAIEREAVEAVPDNLLELNIGHATVCVLACVAIVAVVVALVTCAGGPCPTIRERLDKVSLSASRVRQLGKLASARELLSMRREIFQEFGV